jgi:hypothetical protein
MTLDLDDLDRLAKAIPALIKEVRRLRERERIGAQLANVAYVLAQGSTLWSDDYRALLDRLRHEWDEAGKGGE